MPASTRIGAFSSTCRSSTARIRRTRCAAVELISSLGDTDLADWAVRHKAVVDRFGRFPHRNAVLGRASTPEEEAFLQEPGSSF